MHSVSQIDNYENKYFINIDFGAVPVGSVRKRSIDITNDLKASSYFFVVIYKNFYVHIVLYTNIPLYFYYLFNGFARILSKF